MPAKMNSRSQVAREWGRARKPSGAGRGAGIIQGMTTSTSTNKTSLADLIVKTPGVCGGQPRIIGTRIMVKHVYLWVERMGMTPAQVVAEHPHLTMAQVYAALAYYWSYPEE